MCFLLLGLLTLLYSTASLAVDAIIVNTAKDGIKQESEKTEEILKACGLSVERVEPKDLKDLQSKLSKIKLPKYGNVFVDGHAVDKPEYLYSLGEGTKGKELLASFAVEYNTPQIFLDTCHSGLCPSCEGVGLGTACRPKEISSAAGEISHQIARLMCSRKQGCKEWLHADKNKNGVITGEELTDYFQRLWKNRVIKQVWPVLRAWEIRIGRGKNQKAEKQKFVEDCKKRKGKLVKEFPKFVLRGRVSEFDFAGGIPTVSEVMKYHLLEDVLPDVVVTSVDSKPNAATTYKDKASVEKALTDFNPKWKDACRAKQDILGECQVVETRGEFLEKYECHYESTESLSHPRTTQHPNFDSLQLHGPECAQLENRSGKTHGSQTPQRPDAQ